MRFFNRFLTWTLIFGSLGLLQGALEGAFAFQLKGMLIQNRTAWTSLGGLFLVVSLRTAVQYLAASAQAGFHRRQMHSLFAGLKPGLDQWSQPWHRDPGRGNLGKALQLEMERVVRGREAVLRCTAAGLHAVSLLIGLLLLSPLLAGASLLLVLPLAVGARLRRHWLDGLAVALRRSQARFHQVTGMFLAGLDSARGNRRVPSAWAELETAQNNFSGAEWRWQRAQLSLPALLEWFYFALLATLVFWTGPRFGGLAQPAGALTLLLLLYQPVREFGRHWTWLRLGAQAERELGEFGIQSEPSPPLGRAAPSTSPAVEIRNLAFAYPGAPALFSEWQGEIPLRGWTCLRGPNGAGKSTLLRLLAGVEFPVTGMIRRPQAWSDAGMGYLPQPADFEPDFWPWLRRFFGRGTGVWEAWRDFLGLRFIEARLRPGEVEAAEAEQNFLTELSGGEKQRLALLRVLSGGHGFLLLDEPGTGLPEAECEAIFSRIMQPEITGFPDHRPQGGIIASHHPWFAERCAPRILEL